MGLERRKLGAAKQIGKKILQDSFAGNFLFLNFPFGLYTSGRGLVQSLG